MQPCTLAGLKRKLWREPCWGSHDHLACILQLESAWRCELCGGLNHNDRCSPNPRLSISIHMGVTLVPRRKLWWEPYCGTFVFPLACLLELQCAVRFSLSGILKANPGLKANPWLRNKCNHGLWLVSRRNIWSEPYCVCFWTSLGMTFAAAVCLVF